MATELREAKIVVRMDLQETGDQPAGPERERREREKERHRQGRVGWGDSGGSGRGPSQGNPSVARSVKKQLAHGQIYNAVTEVLKSIPIAGVGFAVAIGAAEINERFGPGVEAFVRGILPDEVQKALEFLGIDVNVTAAISKEWIELKAMMFSLSAAFEGTVNVAASVAVGGGELSPGELASEFGLQREMAELQIEILKTRRRILQIYSGEGAARAVKKAMEESSLPGSVGK